ncbi:MAG TPA: hypothetical protein VK126_01515 [Nitrososphaerales archaeon]|nr:hypothetical protein [Nitrososphaerales archaeon]
MPFKWHLGFELFNDCLYYRRVAKDLIEQDEKGNVFEIRRALRISFICLAMYWESRVNELVYSKISRRLFDQTQKQMLSDSEIDKFKRFWKSDVGLKFDVLELLTGVDFRADSKLSQRIKEMQETRNLILHTGHYGFSTVPNEKFLGTLAEGIETTRSFFAFLQAKKMMNMDKFLANEEPVDLTKQGLGYGDFGFGQEKHPQSVNREKSENGQSKKKLPES